MKRNFIKIMMLSGTLFFVACGGSETASKGETTEAKNEETIVKEEVVEETVTEEVVEESSNTAKGETLFTEKACLACHQPDAKTVGPSLKEISAAYTGNADGLKAFLREEAEAIIDPAMFATMQANLAITKEMGDEDLDALVNFVLSH